MSHIFDWLQLCHHPSFFLHHCKDQIGNPPKPNIWFSNVAPHTKLFVIFAMQLHGGNIKKWDCIAQFVHVPALHCKVTIMQYKKCRRSWWQPDHQTRFKATHRTSSLSQFWQCTTPSHYHGKMPWPSDHPATTSFKNTQFHPYLWSVWISKFQRTGKNKKSRAIFDPVYSSLHSLDVRGRECILVEKSMWVLCISPIFTQNCRKALVIYCVIFPHAAKNTHHQPKRGEVKAIGGK